MLNQTIYHLIKSTDEIIQNTFTVSLDKCTERSTGEVDRRNTEIQVYLRPKAGFPAELVEHLPAFSDGRSFVKAINRTAFFNKKTSQGSQPQRTPRAFASTLDEVSPTSHQPIRPESIGHTIHPTSVNSSEEEFNQMWSAAQELGIPLSPNTLSSFKDGKKKAGTRAPVVKRWTDAAWLGPQPSKELVQNSEAQVITSLTVQILYFVRAALLTFTDIAGPLCKGGSDFIGNAPASDVYSALDLMRVWSLNNFVDFVKYWKDFPMASFLNNPLPPVPACWSAAGYRDCFAIFGGRVGDFYRRLCHPAPIQHPDHVQLFRAVFTISQSKRGFAPVPESFVQEAYEKHAKILSTPPPSSSPEDMSEFKSFLTIFFRNFQPRGLIRHLTKLEGSSSASTSKGRQAGGAREAIRQAVKEKLERVDDSLVRMVSTDQGLIEERGIPPPTEREWLSIACQPIDKTELAYQLDHMADGEVLQAFDTGNKLEILCSPNAPLVAKVVALREPAKVRIITKMEGLSSFLSTPLQKALWNYLQQFPQFALTGRPLDESMLYDLLKSEREFPWSDPEYIEQKGNFMLNQFVSGDYRSATDLLYLQYTLAVIEHVNSLLVDDDKELAKHHLAVLSPQLLVYPGKTGIAPLLQKNGQLMGCILSFPLLCIINLFTYVKSLPDPVKTQVLRGQLSMKKLPVRVNGDDILFRAILKQYQHWQRSAASVGFQLSQGKNFRHPTCFMVNSTPITLKDFHLPHYTLAVRNGSYGYGRGLTNLSWADVEEIPEEDMLLRDGFPEILGFLNIGLLLGADSKVDTRGNRRLVPLNTWYNSSVVPSMNPLRSHNLFLHYHADTLRRLTRFGRHTLNIFAHPMLGGLGFKVPTGVEPRFSEVQRTIAAKLLDAAKTNLVTTVADHPIRPFVTLTNLTKPEMGLGTLGENRLVATLLDAPIGPLVPGLELFEPDTNIPFTPLTQSRIDPDEPDYVMNCRLSAASLRELLKTANHQRTKMLDLDQMTDFPYRVVQITDFDKFVQGASYRHNVSRVIGVKAEPLPFVDTPFVDRSIDQPPTALPPDVRLPGVEVDLSGLFEGSWEWSLSSERRLQAHHLNSLLVDASGPRPMPVTPPSHEESPVVALEEAVEEWETVEFPSLPPPPKLLRQTQELTNLGLQAVVDPVTNEVLSYSRVELPRIERNHVGTRRFNNRRAFLKSQDLWQGPV